MPAESKDTPSYTSEAFLRGMKYSMAGFMQQCIERYTELTKIAPDKIKAAATPGLDDSSMLPEDWETKGELSGEAAKIVMKIIYAARFYRWDLPQSINYLA